MEKNSEYNLTSTLDFKETHFKNVERNLILWSSILKWRVALVLEKTLKHEVTSKITELHSSKPRLCHLRLYNSGDRASLYLIFLIYKIVVTAICFLQKKLGNCMRYKCKENFE